MQPNLPLLLVKMPSRVGSWLLLAGLFCGPTLAEDFSLHGQSTWISQSKPAFAAAYTGEHSLVPQKERSDSWTSTLAVGARLGPSTEVFINPELVQGVPLSGLMGLGGLTNSELQKTAGAKPQAYWARWFIRHTRNLASEASSEVEVVSSMNQIAKRQSSQRWVFTFGRLAITDVFDSNLFAHDGRTQFLNWSFLTHGSYDFAADARGYSSGVVIERYAGPWSVRWARFLVPQESNGSVLNPHWSRQFGDQAEIQVDHDVWNAQRGSLKWLVFHNKAVMAAYDDAWIIRVAGGSQPLPLASVRRLQSKWGWGFSAEQPVNDRLGAFLRVGRHDGKSEGYSFASIDQAISWGVATTGTSWIHPKEEWSLAWANNRLSPSHRRYLSAGGADFFLGDGALRYGSESILELMYTVPLLPEVRATLDYQHVRNPGYNQDRGPVRLMAMRLHAEF